MVSNLCTSRKRYIYIACWCDIKMVPIEFYMSLLERAERNQL